MAQNCRARNCLSGIVGAPSHHALGDSLCLSRRYYLSMFHHNLYNRGQMFSLCFGDLTFKYKEVFHLLYRYWQKHWEFWNLPNLLQSYEWREVEKFTNCTFLMGMFHLLMIYMNLLYMRIAEGGLNDALIQSYVVAEVLIDSALRGKHYTIRNNAVENLLWSCLVYINQEYWEWFQRGDIIFKTSTSRLFHDWQRCTHTEESLDFEKCYNSYLEFAIWCKEPKHFTTFLDQFSWNSWKFV